MLIVSVDDFKGFHRLSLDSSNREILKSFIKRYETFYLNKLLGVDLAKRFIANLDNGVPANIDFRTIFDLLFFCDKHSMGMKDMMLSLIYYDFISDDQTRHTLSGVTQSENENSESKSLQNATRKGEIRWNQGVGSWNVIQMFICDNLGKYEGFDGQKIEPKFSPIL